MPLGTAFHPRTLPLCESLNYREWAGYYAVSAYEMHHEHEYAAIRNGAALIDVSPLFKYRLSGPDATRLVDRIVTRDATKVAVGQVIYTPWCDEHGMVIDDGTVSRLEEQVWRWTAADPNLRWFRQNAAGLRVEVEEISEQVAALSVQGPTSARLISAAGHVDLSDLKYFRLTHGTIAGIPVDVSRTGYTGDLGYEIWMPVGSCRRGVGPSRGGRPRLRRASCWHARARRGKNRSRSAPDRRRFSRIEESAHRRAAIFAIRDEPRAAGVRKEGPVRRARVTFCRA
jgi:aminomethyltransferase